MRLPVGVSQSDRSGPDKTRIATNERRYRLHSLFNRSGCGVGRIRYATDARTSRFNS